MFKLYLEGNHYFETMELKVKFIIGFWCTWPLQNEGFILAVFMVMYGLFMTYFCQKY